MTLEDRKKIILQSYIHYMIGDTDIERITNTHRMTDDAFVMALCDILFEEFSPVSPENTEIALRLLGRHGYEFRSYGQKR